MTRTLKRAMVTGAAGLLLGLTGGMAFGANIQCGGGVCNGTSSGDSINGSNISDSISGLGGSDLISGNDGPDAINGNDGNDAYVSGSTIYGINGNNGGDDIHGNAGNDILFGGNAVDNLYGDGDSDSLFDYQDGCGPDRFYGGTGDDYCYLTQYADQVDNCEHWIYQNACV